MLYKSAAVDVDIGTRVFVFEAGLAIVVMGIPEKLFCENDKTDRWCSISLLTRQRTILSLHSFWLHSLSPCTADMSEYIHATYSKNVTPI
jgi:hypothetical protein